MFGLLNAACRLFNAFVLFFFGIGVRVKNKRMVMSSDREGQDFWT